MWMREIKKKMFPFCQLMFGVSHRTDSVFDEMACINTIFIFLLEGCFGRMASSAWACDMTLHVEVTTDRYPKLRDKEEEEEEEQVFIASAKGRNGPKSPYTQVQVKKWKTKEI